MSEIEKIIAQYENCIKGAKSCLQENPNNDYTKSRIKEYEFVILALKEKQEREHPTVLSLEELRRMDGEPVWMVDGQGHKMYGIVNDTGCADADYGSWDADFYGMTGDGKHGLHIMGWLAYAHKPEQEEK